MANIEVFSSSYITVEYLPDRDLIYHTMHQPIGEAQAQLLKDALTTGSEALAQHGACKWLSDDRKNGPLPQEIIEWAVVHWNLPTIKDGWKYWANVVPTEIAAAGTLMPIINNLHEHGLRMRVFTTVEDALEWLDELNC